MSQPEPPVSWKAIEKDATVVTSDGDESARVTEIVGDPDADIFNGLVITLGVLDKNRHLPAERVQAIWPKRVEVDATLDELKGLPPYDAYTLLSLAGDIRISRTFRDISSVKMMVRRTVLDQLG